ncbi:LON peptidase N-terminal domain and RING finger protein 1-like [Mercenaria mercenaria]|uniref:LON peptidase N-terminal domain and RING finger protein 1-like n=1 Tax=Mercenaria mercenaria TaxID=6596 RepID=UPI001E1D5C58|nr:LON peptidase N-terminal domain and RING finger protein 1-like [Mercenaria mercenaria]
MVDLARQAFNSKNYELATEIYERSISEYGPKPELLLGLADSFARAGHFEKAFTAYSKACRVGSVSHKDLKHLVSSLVNSVKQDKQVDTDMNRNVTFECLICRNMIYDPVTIPCGHTFCRSCLRKDLTKQCKNCGTINHNLNVSRIKSNILLSQIIEHWFPDHCKAVKIKKDANDAFQSCKFKDAIKLYSNAIEMAPTDHILWSNRSHALCRLDRYQEALGDAEHVLQLRPDWPKGYFRRGCALFGLGSYEESVVALLQCLALDSSVDTAKDYLAKALHNIIVPLSPDDPKTAELQRELNPSLLDQLIRSNFDTSLLLPSVTVDTVRQLKEIITDTVATATNFLEGRNRTNTNDQNSGLIYSRTEASTSQQPEGKCLSAPSSRANTPVYSPKRTYSEASNMCYLSQMDNETSNEPVDMVTNANQSNNDNKDAPRAINLPSIDPSVVNKEDFECSLCYRLLHLPVTTPCGHIFCRPCLDKVLDHKTECPLCKSCLAEYLAERRQAVTTAVENLLEAYLPAETRLRKQQHEEELNEIAGLGFENQREIPVFVCTLGYPYVPCPLHIFEPRYRLMVRQCMETGSRQFGMCTATGDGEEDFSEYGCMLEIRDVQFFPDGRSLVDTVGGKRFKVLSRGQREGYSTAKVEFLQDQPADNIEELKSLSDDLYGVCKSWYESLPQTQQTQIRQHLGDFPSPEADNNYGQNGTAWHWWMIAVLPLDPRIQVAMLAMQSYKERLLGLKKVLGFLKHKRDSK